MLRKIFYDALVKQRDIFLGKFRNELIDNGNSHRLGDLFGYFTEDNVNIDNGVISFSVGDYSFKMQAKIHLKEDQGEPQKTSKVVFSTIEIIDDLLRTNSKNEGKQHVKKLDIALYFANKKRVQYDNSTERFHYSMDGLESEYDISGKILEKYSQELIKYIEDVETPTKAPKMYAV